MEELARNAQALAEIRGTDKQGIDSIDCRDLLTLLHSRKCLDLDGDEGFFVGFFRELGRGHCRKPGVPATRVQTTPAAGMELRPPNEFLRLSRRENLRRHHAAGTRFQTSGDCRVIRWSDPAEGIEPVLPRCHRGDFQFLRRESHMLEVKPDPVESALNPEDMDQIVVAHPANTTDSNKLTCIQTLLQRWHNFVIQKRCETGSETATCPYLKDNDLRVRLHADQEGTYPLRKFLKNAFEPDATET